MIIKCDKSDLVTAIRTAMRAVPSKTTMPILECVLIEAKDSGITITANNTEMGIVITLDGEVAESGISAGCVGAQSGYDQCKKAERSFRR